MSIKRYSGTGFTDVSSRKRWNGSAWVDLTIGKRWNGSAWVDLWSASSGSSGSSGGNTGNDAMEPETTKTGKGTFKNGSSTTFTSTASNPPVNYSAAYTYTATGESLSVSVKYACWISKYSTLGKGIRLTVFARLNGGSWKSKIIKSDDAIWTNSADKHYVTINLTGTGKSTNTVEWYVTRSGSSYSGSAGVLGSAGSPKKNTFTI